MPRRTGSTAPGAATRCPPGWPIKGSGWRSSAPPRPHWRPKPKPPPKRKPGVRPRPRRSASLRDARKTGPPRRLPTRNPTARQRNFTDPDSRILLTKDGYIQGYNAQAAVDGKAQIIVAHELTPSMSDHDQLMPLIEAATNHLGRRPKEASADAGYCSEA